MSPKIKVRLDRVQITADGGRNLPAVLQGFNRGPDLRVRRQTTAPTYARCRQLVGVDSGARVYWQYQALAPWLRAWKITVIGNDVSGITRADLDLIMGVCSGPRLLTVELAFDFEPGAHVDSSFIKRHALFGKSWRCRRRYEDTLYYGGRKSAKFVRCYWKPQVTAFRVELELHSQFLREHDIARVSDFGRLISTLVPNHIRFVRVDRQRLGRHLRRNLGKRRARMLCRRILLEKPSIHALCRYLRKQGFCNVHRFLLPMKKHNRALRYALRRWAEEFYSAEEIIT